MTFPAYAPDPQTIADAWAWAKDPKRKMFGSERESMVGRLGEIMIRHELELAGFDVEEGHTGGPDLVLRAKGIRLPVEIKTRDSIRRPTLTHDVLVPAKRFARQGRESALFVFLWAYQWRDEITVYLLGAEHSSVVAKWPFYDTGDPWPGSDHRSKYPVYREQVSRLIPLDRLVEALRV